MNGKVQARPALTLSFFAAGFLALAGGVLTVALDPAILTGPYYQPKLLALAHWLVLGWLGSVFLGAAYQLGPVIAESPLRFPLLGWFHLALHLTGLPCMVYGFAAGNYHWILAGGVLVTSGCIAFVITQLATAQASWRGDPVGCALVIGWFWLAVTLGLGLFMTGNRLAGLESAPSQWLRIHAILGTTGFFLTVFNAVSLRLVPMFAVTTRQSNARTWTSLVQTQAGLLLVAPASLLHFSPLLWLSGLLILSGQLLFLWEILAQLARRHRQLDGPLNWFAGSFLWLPLAMTGLLLLMNRTGLNLTMLEPEAGAVLVFTVYLLGCLTTAVLAMSFKIIPFLVWQAAYGRHLGRSRVPPLSSLVHERLFLLASTGSTLGIIILVGALSEQSGFLIRTAAIMLGVGIGCAMTNFILSGRHLRCPQLQPLNFPTA